jgi:putative molybdopterin biosynthesis protein
MNEQGTGRKIFHRLVTIEEALQAIRSSIVADIGSHEVAIDCASGMVLSESVFSRVDLPPFDRAEMDGYAVNSIDAEGASEREPVTLKVIGSIGAGKATSHGISTGECMEIATGAPLPKGADSVIMVEFTEAMGNGIRIFKGTTPGENVASAGSDVQIGEMLLREGTRIGPREAGLLAAAGLRCIPVFRRPSIGIISTGNELVEPGSALGAGKIYDSNTYALAAAVRQAGGTPVIMGKAGDAADEISKLVMKGIRENDMLLISGGTSAGTGDLVYRVLGEKCEGGVLVHGLNVKPGKPTLVASHKGKVVFGLPGYPVSALMIFDQLVRPLIENMAKCPHEGSRGRGISADLVARVNGAKGRRWFLPVHLISAGAKTKAYPVIASSGAIGTLAKADGYIIIGEEQEYVAVGEKVKAYPFPGRGKGVDIVVMGSHCPGVDLILQIMYEEKGITAKALNVGSVAGLRAVKGGECDIAGMHILDEGEMTYNSKAVAEAGLPEASLVRGYKRQQGIMVARKNPKGIKGMEDALRGGITLVNRNRGSGTRILTDSILGKLADARGISFDEATAGIRGYRWEAKTHSAVAAAVSQGRADMGVGIQSLASSYGLEFIPLKEESYDFLVNPASKKKPAVVAFIKALHSREFKEKIQRFPGYRI